jgi:cobaltochelatase CobN
MNTYEDWAGAAQGLGPMDVCMSVAMPEFDGVLITVPVAFREYGEQDPLTGARAVY